MGINKRIVAGCLSACLICASIFAPRQAAAGISTQPSDAGLSVMAKKKQAVEYTIETDKLEYKDSKGRVRGIVSFSYPQFSGTSAFITKINQQIKKKSQNVLESEDAENIRDSTEYAIRENRFLSSEDQYYWTTECSETYNKDGIVSFAMTENWYAGGVHNRYDYGLNYDMRKEKKLTVQDVVAGKARKEILKAAKKYCGRDQTGYTAVKMTKKYNFYLSDGKVYICFGSYELGHGTSIDIFSVKGSY